jgi:hypothetical protein
MENLQKCQGKSLPRSSQGQSQVVSMFFKAGTNGGVLSTQIQNWSSGLPTLRAGPRFRNPKHETNTKSEYRKTPIHLTPQESLLPSETMSQFAAPVIPDERRFAVRDPESSESSI